MWTRLVTLVSRLRVLHARRRLDDETQVEVDAHLRLLVDRYIRSGMTAAQAQAAASRQFGSVTLIREEVHQLNGLRWLDALAQDLRYAARSLRRTPAFTIAAVLTLALGIGANSAIFALADTALIRPLPFADPDRVVVVWERQASFARGQVNPVDFADWSARNRTFEAMAAIIGSLTAISGADGTAEQVPAQAVTVRFFEVLGVTPLAGRTFQPADDRDPSDVVVLSEGFWRSQFGGDPALVGRQVRLGGRMMTVIGIMPATFQFGMPHGSATGPSRLWTLFSTAGDRSPAERYPHYLHVIGRLKPGVTVDAAWADLAAVAEGIASESPATNAGHGVAVEPLGQVVVGRELRLTTVLLLGVVGFILLLCCANVANLLLARTTARTRELAVRAALGAAPRRIVRQLLTESLVLATLGGVVGAGVGALILTAAPSLIPPGLLPVSVSPAFDGRVAAFCAVIVLIVTLACGLVPAWQVTGQALSLAMGWERTLTSSGPRLRSLLVVAEISVAMLLLCGAGVLLRTLVALVTVDSGARARNVLTMVAMPGRGSSPDSMRQYYETVEREVRSVPGVRQMGWGSAVPLDGRWYGQAFHIVGDPPRPESSRDVAGYQIVSASYFKTLDIPMRAGRAFTDHDRANSPPVCIVNEPFVRRYLRGRDPLRIRLGVQAMAQPTTVVVREIVGVVRQVKEQADEAEDQPHIYVPLAQNPWWMASMVIRPTEGPAAALAPAVRAAVARVDRDRPVTAVRTLDDVVSEGTARPRFRAVFVGSFAALATALAVIGVFGVLAYTVQQRTREFGVRIALGANARDVLRLVLTSAARMTVIGTAIGLGAGAVFSRSIASLLFGVQPLDPATFAVSALTLGLTAILAAAGPALRAARVDPITTLRAE